jgi:hypothetical protein
MTNTPEWMGRYNDPPPNFQRLEDPSEFWCLYGCYGPGQIFFKQICPTKDIPLDGRVLLVHLHLYSGDRGYGVSVEQKHDWKTGKTTSTPTFWKFYRCDHNYHEIAGPNFRCYHTYKCERCGHTYSVDSSD